ncbi:MAG: hypothetical protein ACR2H5_12430 [Ktedonobacteraceae bacterium]
MSQQGLTRQRSQRLSLSVRVSFMLMFAAILPLIIIVATSELLSRPALISQANLAMASDASSRTKLIEAYFTERLLDTATLSQVPSLQTFMAAPPGNKDLATHAIYALAAGRYRDNHYTIWSLFDMHGNLRLYYPAAPQAHGQYLVPPPYLQSVTAGKSLVSAVYFDPKTQKASVDIYAPVINTASNSMLGFVRATLTIDYIWDIVNGDHVNGSGSYAFILDQNGVRIADPNASRRFTAISNLPSQTQQFIASEARYGSKTAVPVLKDTTLANVQSSHQSTSTMQMTPTGQSESFQVTRQTISTVPWTYYVLSPVSTVTAIANQQRLIIVGIALGVLILAAIVGVGIGRRITGPILKSVEYLRGNSQSLNTLASKQQSAAAEQKWVVDSSQIGLQSVQYYTDATLVAAHQLGEIGSELSQHWHQLDAQTAKGALEQMIKTAQYIESAAQYQSSSNQKLSTAIKVTTQVTEQLVTGATSATDAATQLEQVVNQLRDVVGK